MRSRLLLLISLIMVGLSGCHYYQEYRQIKGDADIMEERAELMKAYRLCVAKYEADPGLARERCEPYQEALQKLEGKSPERSSPK